MRWRRAAGTALAVGAGVVALGAGLGASGLRLAVDCSGGEVAVSALGHRFEAFPYPVDDQVKVHFHPQERFSTPQVLLPHRHLLLDGWAALPAALSRRPARPQEFAAPPGTRVEFLHFNPFRASFTVRGGGRELRLEINIPDASLEAWEGSEKRAAVPLHPPFLRLTVAPLLAALAVAGLLAVPLRRAVPPASTAADPAPGRSGPRWWEVGVAGVAGALAVGWVLLGVARAMPGFGDEMNYLMQGRIFAAGRLWVPEPPDPEFFRVDWMDMFGSDGKVWGFHPPGNAALLALGWLAGVYWLPVPLLGGAFFAVQYLLAWEVFRRRSLALLHLAVLGSSHYVLSLAGSFMAHLPAALALSIMFLGGLKFLAGGGGRRVVWAALAGGVAFTIRPLGALLAAFPLGVAMLVRGWRRHRRALALAAAVGAAAAAPAFLYTWGITGRFTLPYTIKGPEAPRTLAVRLGRPMQEHLANLYRNLNELQHRVHSAGILGNLALGLLPLWLGRRWGRAGRALALAGGTFAFFAVVHSFLHWYGWKWEPRLLYDVSFLFVLVTTAGVGALVGVGERSRWFLLPRTALLAGLAAVVAIDLPYRFSSEYRDYNRAPAGVRDEVRRQGISEAVIFFGAELPYSCYTPFNTPDFAGDPLFARDRGPLANYRLLARFPHRQAFFSADGTALGVMGNFYRRDLERLAGLLSTAGEPRPLVVVPWARVAPSPLLDRLPGLRVEVGELFATLEEDGGGRVVAVLPGAGDVAVVLEQLYVGEELATAEWETAVRVRRVGGRRPGAPAGVPGLAWECFAGQEWRGQPLAQGVSASVSADLCPGEERSLRWLAHFALPRSAMVELAVTSDDGAGVWIDGKLFLDNGLHATHGRERRTARVELGAGEHTLEIRYFNGPGEAFLEVEVGLDGAAPSPLGLASFGPGEALLRVGER